MSNTIYSHNTQALSTHLEKKNALLKNIFFIHNLRMYKSFHLIYICVHTHASLNILFYFLKYIYIFFPYLTLPTE